MPDLPHRKFRNPAYVRTRFFLFSDRIPVRPDFPAGEFDLGHGRFGRYSFQSETDYALLQLFVTVRGRRRHSVDDLRAAADSAPAVPVPVGAELLAERECLLVDEDLSDSVSYSDPLAYDVLYKKLDGLRILYSPVPGNEFLPNFLKHLTYFELYYAKVERFYSKFKSEVYPRLRRMHSELIRTCSDILDPKRKTWKESDLKTLSGWALSIDELNFALGYDMESVESNLSNMKSRIRTIGAENSRYFQNHVEKAEFVLDTFDKARDKNDLIKETILKNGIEYVAARREEAKLANETAKIGHVKNIKELVSGLAFIEIFINGMAEAVGIAGWSGALSTALSNTAFMRMVLLSGFIVGYFVHYFWVSWNAEGGRTVSVRSERA